MTGVAKGETGSFWLDQIAPASDKPVTVCPPAQCDICIIGCGITGAALAYYLSRPNSLDPEAQKPSIVVLEARSIAGGATGRNGGILWPDSSDEFEVGGQAVVHDFISEHKVDCGWNAAGGISLVGNPLLTKVSEGLDADQARDDDPHERDLLDGLTQVDPEQILHAAPHTFRTGYKDDKVVSFWPAKVTAALAQLAIAAGVVVCEHCEVSSVGKSRKADGLVPIASSKGTVHGRTVIVATNGWIPRLLPELQPHIRPCTNTVLSSAEAVPPHLRWPVAAISCGAGSHEVYASVTRNGILILGGLRDSGEEWSGDNDQPAGDPKVVQALGKWFETAFPEVSAAVSFNKSWLGVLSFPTDGLPVVGPLPGRPNVFVCGGYCGHGMPRAMRLARALAQRTLDLPCPDADILTQWDVARFF